MEKHRVFTLLRCKFCKYLSPSVNSDGEEMNMADNSDEIYYSLNYEADLLFTRFDNLSKICLLRINNDQIMIERGRKISDRFFYVQRESHPSRYDIKSELALEEPGVIGPPFNLTFQVRSQTAFIAHQYFVFYLKI